MVTISGNVSGQAAWNTLQPLSTVLTRSVRNVQRNNACHVCPVLPTTPTASFWSKTTGRVLNKFGLNVTRSLPEIKLNSYFLMTYNPVKQHGGRTCKVEATLTLLNKSGKHGKRKKNICNSNDKICGSENKRSNDRNQSNHSNGF